MRLDLYLILRSALWARLEGCVHKLVPIIRKDGAEANPADDLKTILAELGLEGKHLGVEFDAYGLTAANGKRVPAARVW